MLSNIRRFFTFFARDAVGVSLVQLMVLGAVLMGLGVGMMQLSKESAKSHQRSVASFETEGLLYSIHQNLLNIEACKHTFKDLSSYSGGTQIPSIKNRVNQVVFNTQDQYRGNTIKIDSMKIISSELNSTKHYGNIIFEVRLERLKTNTGKFIHHNIGIKMKVDENTGELQKCYALTGERLDDSDLDLSVIERSKNEFCTSVGGSFDRDRDTCHLSDTNSGTTSDTSGQQLVSTKYLKEESDRSWLRLDGTFPMTGNLNIPQKVCRVSPDGTNEICQDFGESLCQRQEIVEKISAQGKLRCRSLICPASSRFVGLLPDGGIECYPLPTKTCGTNEYISKINSDGSYECEPLPHHFGVVCPEGRYLKKVNKTLGGTQIECGEVSEMVDDNNCLQGFAIGFDRYGNILCDSSSVVVFPPPPETPIPDPRTCSDGRVWDEVTKTCSCPPETEVSHFGWCRACSDTGKIWNGFACTCPEGSNLTGARCGPKCSGLGAKWDSTLKKCTCTASETELSLVNDRKCIPCSQGGKIWNAGQKACVCPAGYAVGVNGNCVKVGLCPNEQYSSYGNICLPCSHRAGGIWNGTVCACPPPNITNGSGDCLKDCGKYDEKISNGNGLVTKCDEIDFNPPNPPIWRCFVIFPNTCPSEHRVP